MKNISTKRRLGLIIVAVAIVAGLTWYAVARNRHDGEVVLYGNVDIRAVTLGFRVPGRVATVAVDEGDAVRAGQELARLDTGPLELAAGEARANANAVAARVRLLKSGYRSEDVAQAEATVAERRAALANAEQQYQRQQELHGTGAVAQRIYDDAVAGRDQARARLAAAEAALAELRRGYRQQEIAEAEANAARAAAASDQARQHLDDAVLRAPSDGVVTTRSIEAGAIVAAGTPALTLTLQSPVWVRAYIDEPDLGRVAPGAAVRVYTDSRPDRPYHGRIGFVSPTAEFTPKNVETPDLRTALVYRARIIVRDPDAGLRQGMPVTAYLESRTGEAKRP